MDKLEINLMPYKNMNKIKKYHILDNKNHIFKFKINNVRTPFGPEISNNQYRFNIGFKTIENEFINNIKLYENYFNEFDDFKDYKLHSNIIDRDSYGIIIRCHLKTYKNNIITPLNHEDNGIIRKLIWKEFDKTSLLNINYTFDSLWINEDDKTYGISILILSILQK
jgi:hypothetical protein